MGKAGRPPGPLRGRTEQANALAQFLRELTAESTVSDLEKRYSLARSSWSEYRSGQKIIPWERLGKVVEHRFPHDPRARQLAMDKARRLHAAATSAQPPTTAVAAPIPQPAAVRPAAGQPADNPPTSTDTAPTLDTPPDPALPGPLTAALPDPVRPRPQNAGSPGPQPSAPPAPGPGTADPLPVGAPPAPAAAPRKAAAGTLWWTRWRTPVQWALLAALLAAVIIANQAQRPGGQTTAAPPPTGAPDSAGTPPVDVPQETPTASSTPEQPTTSPTPDPPAPAPSTPSTPSSSPAAVPTAAPTAARPSATSAGPAPVPAVPAAPPRRVLRNVATGLCVDVPTGGVPNMGHPVVQERCGAGGHLQQFDLVPAAGGASGFALRPAGSTLCVDPPEHGAPANAQVGLYPCDLTGGDNHLWRLQWNDTNAVMLVNVKSEGTATLMCLDVPGLADPTPGLRLGVYPCHPNPGDDQWWTLT
ncbi:ricin-type beta-trefoil lectin domain protein [Kitasatospora sp. NPDC004240]